MKNLTIKVKNDYRKTKYKNLNISNAWKTMMASCYNLNYQALNSVNPHRGHTVCERWRKFSNFQDDVINMQFRGNEQIVNNLIDPDNTQFILNLCTLVPNQVYLAMHSKSPQARHNKLHNRFDGVFGGKKTPLCLTLAEVDHEIRKIKFQIIMDYCEEIMPEKLVDSNYPHPCHFIVKNLTWFARNHVLTKPGSYL